MQNKIEQHEYLTGKVITQEFTTCSIKAVRLADRIVEWHENEIAIMKQALFERGQLIMSLEQELEKFRR